MRTKMEQPMTPKINTSVTPEDRELIKVEEAIMFTFVLMQDLDSKFWDLPLKKPERKSSDIEESLYAQKEEAAKKLDTHLKTLIRYQKTVNEIIKKNKLKRGILGQDKKQLSTKKATELYSFSEFIQENRYKYLLECKAKLDRVITAAMRAIEFSNTKKFPWGKPKKKVSDIDIPSQPQVDIGSTPSMSHISTSSPDNPSTTNQINSLLSLGPLGK